MPGDTVSNRRGLPRLGVSLPTFGAHAGPDAIVTVATAAEGLGFDSVSASERLLLPAGPGWRNEAGLPESYVWDTLETLTWAAAHTSRIRLLTAIVNSLFQPPIVLARRLATLDQLSRGRLDAGIGQGWLPEEFTATGVPMARRGAGFEDHLAAMRACWAPDPVEHDGPHYRIPRSTVGPKPFNGRLPVLIGGLAGPAVERAARLADGFVTGVREWETTSEQIQSYRDAGGTGPVVALVMSSRDITRPDEPAPEFAASAAAAIERATAAGVDEVHFELNLAGVHPDRQVEALEALVSKVGR